MIFSLKIFNTFMMYKIDLLKCNNLFLNKFSYGSTHSNLSRNTRYLSVLRVMAVSDLHYAKLEMYSL